MISNLKSILAKFQAALKRYDDVHNFTCDVCGREVFENERICRQCERALPHNYGVICPCCGRKVREAGVCLECKQKPLVLKKARSCFLHEGEAVTLVHRFKKGDKYLYRTLVAALYPLFEREFSDIDMLTFVPMTEQAFKKRGYNQSRLLAEELTHKSGKEFFDGVRKTRETQAQKTLGRKEREENLKGSFHISFRKKLKGKHVLIVDDTMTTGATANELATVLLRAGAQSVSLITVTSVEKKDPFGKPVSNQRKI